MKRLVITFSTCTLLAAAFFTIHCFADGTNGVAGENQKKKIVPEDGPLKEIATIVLNTGTKMKLDSVESPYHTIPGKAAMKLGLVSSDNEPFMVYGLDSLKPYSQEEPSDFVMIRVSQQRGKADIIFVTVTGIIGNQYLYNLYLTSPSGVLEKALVRVNQASDYSELPIDGKSTQSDFNFYVNFWSEKLGVSSKNSEEPKK
jgi:hypothetical protein